MLCDVVWCASAANYANFKLFAHLLTHNIPSDIFGYSLFSSSS